MFIGSPRSSCCPIINIKPNNNHIINKNNHNFIKNNNNSIKMNVLKFTKINKKKYINKKIKNHFCPCLFILVHSIIIKITWVLITFLFILSLTILYHAKSEQYPFPNLKQSLISQKSRFSIKFQFPKNMSVFQKQLYFNHTLKFLLNNFP